MGQIVFERISMAIAKKPFVFEGQKIPVTLSCGVSKYQAEGTVTVTDSTQLLSFADELLYKAKESGRNRVEIEV